MRMIDAEKLREVLENVKNHLEAYPNVLASYKECVMSLIDVVNAQPTITPPPNDLLTPEQLREMGEEWVWIELLAPLYGMDSSYYIKMPPFSDVDKLCCGYPGIVIRGLPYSGYGDLWLAYRRRPEIDP